MQSCKQNLITPTHEKLSINPNTVADPQTHYTHSPNTLIHLQESIGDQPTLPISATTAPLPEKSGSKPVLPDYSSRPPCSRPVYISRIYSPWYFSDALHTLLSHPFAQVSKPWSEHIRSSSDIYIHFERCKNTLLHCACIAVRDR